MINTVCMLKNLKKDQENSKVTVRSVNDKYYNDKFYDVIEIEFNGVKCVVDSEDILAAVDKCSSRQSGRRHPRRLANYYNRMDEDEGEEGEN